ncbi:hypothetical protein E1B28_000108 [Marasmius oreades]|uniref:F-box domain-containing protein n=1 Tax=Marasmius oreades TaxID=181124 RepID=A0A9P7V0N7_9AGAR|nr:uncharacterized protein E1B28_000108 [Marasmius oreades]KAG7098138.1 hypothetical protein E1B28_000108 [Marasmius oreades]
MKGGKRKREPTASDSEFEDDDTDERAVQKEKRGRKKFKRARGRLGALQNIQEMPLDVVYEIFTHLEPYDLLKLSRTSKSLRNIVLNRSVSPLWKNAREKAGIPEPIPTMSEPAFIDLLFDRYCHFCGGAAAYRNCIIWSALVRCCKRCLKVKFVSLPDALNCDRYDTPPQTVCNTLPRYQDPRRHFWVYLRTESEKLVKEYKALPASEVRTWIAQRAELFRRIEKQIDVCKVWLSAQDDKRAQELERAREGRLESITCKVVELGFSRLVTSVEEFRSHSLVNQPKVLTERYWRKMKPDIEELSSSIQARLLRDCKKKRVEVLREVLRDWDLRQTFTFMTPSVWDIALWEPFRSVIEDLPLDGGHEPSIFDDGLTQLLPPVEEWNRNQTKKVLAALQKYQPDATEADLHLATSLFRCAACSRFGPPFYAYPGILSHVCVNPGRFVPPADFKPPDWYFEKYSQKYPSAVTTHIEVAKSAVDLTKEIGELVGIDVGSTLMSAMFALNPTLIHDSDTRNWSKLVTLEARHELKIPSDESLKIKRARGWEKRLSNWEQSLRHFLCKRCPSYRSSLENVKKHLTETHGVTAVCEEDLEYSPFNDISSNQYY